MKNLLNKCFFKNSVKLNVRKYIIISKTQQNLCTLNFVLFFTLHLPIQQHNTHCYTNTNLKNKLKYTSHDMFTHNTNIVPV